MERELIITAHRLDIPASVETTIRERAASLERHYSRLVACSVVVEGPGQRHASGGPYSVQIDLRVPGGEPLIVNRQRAEHLEVAIRDAFAAAARQLEDFARVKRGKVKRQAEAGA